MTEEDYEMINLPSQLANQPDEEIDELYAEYDLPQKNSKYQKIAHLIQFFPQESITYDDLSKIDVKGLREMAEELGQRSDGNKVDIVPRIIEAITGVKPSPSVSDLVKNFDFKSQTESAGELDHVGKGDEKGHTEESFIGHMRGSLGNALHKVTDPLSHATHSVVGSLGHATHTVRGSLSHATHKVTDPLSHATHSVRGSLGKVTHKFVDGIKDVGHYVEEHRPHLRRRSKGSKVDEEHTLQHVVQHVVGSNEEEFDIDLEKILQNLKTGGRSMKRKRSDGDERETQKKRKLMMTPEDFGKVAEPLEFYLEDLVYQAEPKIFDFESGTYGWSAVGQEEIMIDGKPVKIQFNLNLTAF